MRYGIHAVTLLVLMIALAPTGRSAAGKERCIAVIVHPDNATNDIPMETLRAIFLKQQSKWPDGRQIIVLNSKARNPVRVAFDLIVLNMLPEEAAAYWIDRRIRGKGHPPRSLVSALLIQRIVARNPEAVAYVPADKVSGKVKVIAVDGRKPGSKGYLLHMEAER